MSCSPAPAASSTEDWGLSCSGGFSFRAHEKFWLGVALRLPFSKQTANLTQNVGAASDLLPTPFYARVKNDLGGMGFPLPSGTGAPCLCAMRRSLPVGEALAYEANLFGLISSTADMREGMQAFLEKREPEP